MMIYVIIGLRAGAEPGKDKQVFVEEAANAWRVWKAGIIRENHARLEQAVFDSALDTGEPFDRTFARLSHKGREMELVK